MMVAPPSSAASSSNSQSIKRDNNDNKVSQHSFLTFKNNIIQQLYINLAGQEPWDTIFVLLLLVGELVLGLLILKFVPYTEIDWQAYMQEVDMWYIDGEYDYQKIYGGTGPLVYPAGFLYLYLALQFITNRQISNAQFVFFILHLITQGIVFSIYKMVLQQIRNYYNNDNNNNKETNTTKVQQQRQCHTIWSFRIIMGCLCLSKRYHSIFLLRLFNDGPTMLLFYISCWCFMSHKWNIGCLFFSLAVSIKMNILLFAPGLLYLLLQASFVMTIPRLAICGITQILLGAPFLLQYPISYLRKAFELDRKFFYKWTVNFKFLSEETFLSSTWSIYLLLLHVGLLIWYFWRLYTNTILQQQKQNNYYFKTKNNTNDTKTATDTIMTPDYILSILFISNFIGIACARTLHYQFYAWYVSALPYLLWKHTPYPLPLQILILAAIEYSFLVFPATPLSSSILQVAHWSIIVPIMYKPLGFKMQQEFGINDSSKKE